MSVVASTDPTLHERQEGSSSFPLEHLHHPWKVFKSMLPPSTDSKIVRLIKYGGILTAVGMYLLFALWPLSNLVLGSAHTVSQIVFHASYWSINLGIVTVLALTVFQTWAWMKTDVENVL